MYQLRYYIGAGAEQPDLGSQGLGSDIMKLVEARGLSSLAQEVGFVDKNNEIEKLKTYDGTNPPFC